MQALGREAQGFWIILRQKPANQRPKFLFAKFGEILLLAHDEFIPFKSVGADRNDARLRCNPHAADATETPSVRKRWRWYLADPNCPARTMAFRRYNPASYSSVKPMAPCNWMA